MEEEPTASLEKHFGKLVDHRGDNVQQQVFLEILIIWICAVNYRVDGWNDAEAISNGSHGSFGGESSVPKAARNDSRTLQISIGAISDSCRAG